MPKKYSRFFLDTKKIILFIYDFRCTFCSFQSFSNHLHHCNGVKGDDHLFNLAVLCKDCHRITHAAHIKISPNPNPQQLEQLRQLYAVYILDKI